MNPGRCGKMLWLDIEQLGEALSAECGFGLGLQPMSFCPSSGSLSWRKWSHDQGNQRYWLKEQAVVGGPIRR